MKKRIAIPLEGGLLCPHFGHCEQFALIEVNDNNITKTDYLTPPDHVPGLYPRWIAQYKVTDVIAGGMGQKAIDLFNNEHINVFVGAPVKNPKELVNDFINDKLDLNANYCDHKGHHDH